MSGAAVVPGDLGKSNLLARVRHADKAKRMPKEGNALTSFPMLLAGAGVKPGFFYGNTDALGVRAVEGRMHTNDLHATILAMMGAAPQATHLSLWQKYT